jgi:glycosyltransferase involved in cell wall biosynthesis
VTDQREVASLSNRPGFLPGSGKPGLVSIIIPCYNRANIVRETIESVLEQTYSNFEIILIDDGSTDNTREVVSTYTDRRVRYFYKANAGLSAARNSGLDAARGQFIAFLDSDDLWESWKLATQIEIFARHSDVGLIWSDMSAFTTMGQIVAERHLRQYYSAYSVVNFEQVHAPNGTLASLGSGAPGQFAGCHYYVADVFQHMFSGNLVHPSTAIVRRERLQKSGPFEPEVTGLGAEDYHFYFRICSHGPVAFLDAPTTLYRLHPAQLSTCNRLHEARGNLKVVMHWLEKRPANLPEPTVQRSLAGSHAWLGAEELNAGNSRAAVYHLWQSLRLETRQPSTIRLLLVSLVPPRAAGALRVMKRVLRRDIVRPLFGVGLLFLDDGSSLLELANLVQSSLASAM